MSKGCNWVIPLAVLKHHARIAPEAFLLLQLGNTACGIETTVIINGNCTRPDTGCNWVIPLAVLKLRKFGKAFTAGLELQLGNTACGIETCLGTAFQDSHAKMLLQLGNTACGIETWLVVYWVIS